MEVRSQHDYRSKMKPRFQKRIFCLEVNGKNGTALFVLTANSANPFQGGNAVQFLPATEVVWSMRESTITRRTRWWQSATSADDLSTTSRYGHPSNMEFPFHECLSVSFQRVKWKDVLILETIVIPGITWCKLEFFSNVCVSDPI